MTPYYPFQVLTLGRLSLEFWRPMWMAPHFHRWPARDSISWTFAIGPFRLVWVNKQQGVGVGE